jgi:hypothetical protein
LDIVAVGVCFVPLEVIVVREEGVTSFGDGVLSNCQTPHDEQVAVGLEVSCDETVVILMLSWT